MSEKVTKGDVLLYFADKLVRTRRIELEQACESDPEVKKWFDELMPTDEEINQMPLSDPPDPNSEESRRIAAITYESIQREKEKE